MARFVVRIDRHVDQVRRRTQVDATEAPLDAGHIVEAFVEDFARVMFAIVVGVFKNDKAIIRTRISGFPLGVCGHACGPEAPPAVEIELAGFGELRELAFTGEEFDLKAFRNPESFQVFFRGENAGRFGFGVFVDAETG